MAAFLKWLKTLPDSTPGVLISVLAYALMLLLVLAFFTGNGAFIYEAF